MKLYVYTTNKYYYWYRRRTETPRECYHSRTYCRKRIALCLKHGGSSSASNDKRRRISFAFIFLKEKLLYCTSYIAYARRFPSMLNNSYIFISFFFYIILFTIMVYIVYSSSLVLFNCILI